MNRKLEDGDHEEGKKGAAWEERQVRESATSEREVRLLSNLPTDIVDDILLRLPIGTLSLCRAVSKNWYQTIKHPGFIKAFNTKVIQNSNSPSVIPYIEEDFHSHKLDPNEETIFTFYTPTPKHISQIYSCNGWVLCVTKPLESHFISISNLYFICNPITGEHMVVPESPIKAYGAITGFGWDPVSKVFKVIRISDDCTHKLYFGTYLEVYNSGTGNWSVKKWGGLNNREPCRASHIFRFKLNANVVFNGFLHWITYPYGGTMSIVSLKLDTEEFQQVPMPPGLDLDPIESRPQFLFFGIGIPNDMREFQHHLVVLGECLSLVHNVNGEHVEIWMMKDYGVESSWKKQYVVRNIVMDNMDSMKGPYMPIRLMQNGEILLLCSEQILGYYNPVTKGFRPIDSGDVLYHPSDSQQPLNIGSLIYLTRKQ